jgi:hypothetical protein
MEQINLDTFYKLFTYECKNPISVEAQNFYIKLVYSEFVKRKSLGISNDKSGFELDKMKYVEFFEQIYLDELNLSGLILVSKTIKFYPMWLKYLNNENPNEIKLVTNYIDDLSSQMFKESICMKCSITMDYCEKLIKDFIQEQSILKSTYFQSSDVLRHCSNWIAKKPKNKNVSTSNKL